jgi:hypothetical protein
MQQFLQACADQENDERLSPVREDRRDTEAAICDAARAPVSRRDSSDREPSGAGNQTQAYLSLNPGVLLKRFLLKQCLAQQMAADGTAADATSAQVGSPSSPCCSNDSHGLSNASTATNDSPSCLSDSTGDLASICSDERSRPAPVPKSSKVSKFFQVSKLLVPGRAIAWV